MKLNLGCGQHPLSGWANIDLQPLAEGVCVHDLREPWPIETDSVEAIYSCHFLEHLTPRESRFVLSEAFRVLRPDGVIRLVVPDLAMIIRAYTAGPGYWAHVWPVNPVSMGQIAECSPGDLFNWAAYDSDSSSGAHLQMFDEGRLSKALMEAGFSGVRRTPSDMAVAEVFKGIPPFANQSLAIEARKPGWQEAVVRVSDIDFAVTMATNRRAGGSRALVHKTMYSLQAQTHQGWHLCLVGDCYDPDWEFEELPRVLPPDKYTALNLPYPGERGRFLGDALWNCAGTNAMNASLDIAYRAGFTHIAHLDDDDTWTPDHLELLANAYRAYPEVAFVYTRGLHNALGPTPGVVLDPSLDNYPPTPAQALHSATSWRLDLIPLRYRNVVQLRGSLTPSDADMWLRISAYCRQRGLHTLLLPEMTVGHVEGRAKL